MVRELAPLVDPGSVASAVVAALGLKADPDRPDVDVLVDVLSDRTELLVLDNCEHVLNTAASLAGRLIHHCPDVSLVATSREALNVAGETVYRVPSLACPAAEAPTDEIAECEAVKLFLDRAHDRGVAIESDVVHLRAVAEICRRLDGMPLAIELAAARTTAMSVQQLHDQLADRFRLLTGGSRSVLPRQQTLRALIDWSYDALSARDQDVLRLLAVFSGGFHLSEGQAALGRSGIDAWDSFDAIVSLVDKNLVQADETVRGMRYWLLETVRQYATERMIDQGADAMQAAREAHLDVFVELATTARPELFKSEQRSWLRRLEAEVDNFRSALTFGLEQSSTRERCARLADAIIRLHWRAGVLGAELTDVHTRLSSDPDVPDDLRVDLLGNLGTLVLATSTEIARNHAAAAVALARRIGDTTRLAEQTLLLADVELTRGDLESTLSLMAEGRDIALSIGDELIATWAQGIAGLALSESEPLRSQQMLEACVAFYTATGDHRNRGVSLGNLGVLELAAGRFETARSYLEASQMAVFESGTTTVSEVHYDLGLAAHGLGDTTAARHHFAEAMRIDLASGDWRRVGFDLLAAAFIASRSNRCDDAATLHAAADCVMQDVGASFESFLQRWQESDMAHIMGQLGEQAIEVARVAGQHLSRSEAVALARTVLTDVPC